MSFFLKLKQNYISYSSPQWFQKGIIVTALLVLFVIPTAAQADFKPETSCQAGLASSFSNRYVCPQGSFVVQPTALKSGATFTATFDVTDAEAVKLYNDQSRTLQIYKCTDSACADIEANKVTSQDFGTSSLPSTLTISVGGVIANPGSYRLKGKVQFADKRTKPLTTYVEFISYANITVTSGPATGVPALSLDILESSTPDTTTARKKLTYTYNDGGTGKQPTKYEYYCGIATGNGGTPFSNPNFFTCDYPRTKADYTASIKAYFSDGTNVVGTYAVSITGAENLQGSQAANKDPNSGIVGLINQILAAILSIVTEFLYALFFWLVAPTIQAMLSIHTYSDTFVNVIYPGWEVVRNVSNIFFIVSLIAMAMGTLFRMANYQFRALLVQIIIAALLVNFSLVIAQAILALADTVQSQFLPNNVEVIRSLARDLMVTNTRNVIFNGGDFSTIVSLLFYVSLSIASFGVFFAIMVYLIIRIVAIWILLLVSPLAYVAGILPQTASLRSQWWSTFIKYAFFTPIMAFFLNMAAVISTVTPDALKNISGADFASSNAPGLSSFVFKIASNILLLVFLYASLKAAESAGVYGASAITKSAQKGWFAPFKLAAAPFAQGAGKASDNLNKLRMNTALKLGADKRDGTQANVFSRAAAGLLATDARTKAKKEERSKDLHNLEHNLQERYTTRVRQGMNKPAHLGELHSLDSQSSESMKHITAKSGGAIHHNIDEIRKSKDIDINKRADIFANMKAAAEEGNFEDLLKAEDLPTDEEGYIEFLHRLQRPESGNFTHDQLLHVATVMDGYFKKTNRVNFIGVADMDKHKLVENVPSQAIRSDAFNDYQRIEKMPENTPAEKALKDTAIAASPYYKPYKPYFDMKTKQKRMIDRKGLGNFVSEFPPAGVVVRDITGVETVSDHAADVFTQGGEDLYSQSGKVNDGLKLAMERMAKEHPDKVHEAFTESIHRAQLKDGIVDHAGAEVKATEKYREVYKRLFNFESAYNPAARASSPNVRVPKTDDKIRDIIEADSVANADLADIVSTEPKIANAIVQVFDQRWKNPENYKWDFPPKLKVDIAANPAISTQANNLQNFEAQKVTQQFSKRFVPADLGLPTMNSTQVTTFRNEIQRSMTDVVANPPNRGLTLKQLKARGDLETDLRTKLGALTLPGATVPLSHASMSGDLDKIIQVTLAGL